jgi:hypothetical protein
LLNEIESNSKRSHKEVKETIFELRKQSVLYTLKNASHKLFIFSIIDSFITYFSPIEFKRKKHNIVENKKKISTKSKKLLTTIKKEWKELLKNWMT